MEQDGIRGRQSWVQILFLPVRSGILLNKFLNFLVRPHPHLAALVGGQNGNTWRVSGTELVLNKGNCFFFKKFF